MRLTGVPVFAVSLLLVVFASAQADASVLDACVNSGNGMMRLVDATTVCHANETRVEWNQVGPQGPAGPTGSTGPAGPTGPPGPTSAGGAPYVYVCTPINYNNAGTSTDNLYVFNGSASTANVGVNFLNKNGSNLSGAPIAISAGTLPPGDPAPLYPGQTGSSTVTLAPANTMQLTWYTAQGNLQTDTNIAISLRITSDQPIVATTNTVWNGFNVVPCSLLPH